MNWTNGKSLISRRASSELERYRESVKSAVTEKSGSPIYNASLDHAKVIVAEIFGNANMIVRLFTGRLNADVYGDDDVCEMAQRFVFDRDGKLHILIEDDVPAEELARHPFFEKVETGSNVEVRYLKRELYDTKFHMMLMDEDSYRFEPDKNEPEAVAAFGDESTGAHLVGLFNTLWEEDSKPVFA